MEHGCAVALATDHNPGSTPSGNMNLVLSLACIQLRMLPEEAINAATLNAAAAMALRRSSAACPTENARASSSPGRYLRRPFCPTPLAATTSTP